MVKVETTHNNILADHVRLLFFILLLGLLASCSEDDNDPIPEPPDPPIEESQYFESVGNVITYDAKELVEKAFNLTPGEEIPITIPDIKVKVEEIKYHSVDPKGNPVIASGIISYPSSGNYSKIVLSEHFTIAKNTESPSSQLCTMESALTFFDCLVISPDYLGFGSTKDLRHPYLHIENTARISIDMLFAVREYMEMKEKPLSKNIYIVGYSQGGAASLAIQKMIEEKYTDEITINKTMAGGGPYDLTTMFNRFTSEDYTGYPCSVPMTIIGMDYGENLNLDYSKIFIDPLFSNYNEWINSKEYTTGEINQKLNSNALSTYMHPDIFTEEKNSEFNKIYDALEKNSLIHWTPKAPILMVHGQKDEVVPYFCAQNAYDSFTQKGANVRLIPVDSDHKGTAISFYLLVLKEIL